MAQSRASVEAEIRFGVGSAYAVRLAGVRAENLEKAIALLTAALSGWTREEESHNWAKAHNNLGIAYWARIRGERADSQERAIAHFEAALTVFTRETAPQEWAQLRNNLGVAFWNRVRGDRAASLETAIAHFEAALAIFTRSAHPHLWAQVQNNLGSVYRQRIRGERAENRDKAITYLEAALTELSREAAPQEWASAHSNLAAAYLDRIRGERAGNQDKALAHIEAALTVFTREGSPFQWAKSQRILGDITAGRLRGEHAANRKQAVAAYEAALSVFTTAAFPQEHMVTARLLGRLHLEGGDWLEAGEAHATAREAFLALFGLGLEEAEARTLIAEAGPLFAEAAFGAAQRGAPEIALQLASEGRARLLAVSMRLQALDLTDSQRRRLEELRTAIRSEQQVLGAARAGEREAAVERLAKLRQELGALIQSSGARDDRPFAAALRTARDIAAAGGVIVVPIITGLGGKIIVVSKGERAPDLKVIDLPELTPGRLSDLLIGPTGGAPAGWLAAYFVNYLEGAEQNRRWPEWMAAIDNLGPELWALFGSPLQAVLDERGIRPGTRLIWIPSGWLGALPLGLAQDPATKRRLADDYEIVYEPSLEALAASHAGAARDTPARLAAIVNPTGDLPGTDREGTVVASHFRSSDRVVLKGRAATPVAVLAALEGRSYWHFASHGTFSWSDARQSALLMHGPTPLTVGRLLDAEVLGRPRLVVLSACETGLADITSNPDEFIGLPATFLALGATGVVGTLWPVSDEATALLIAKFYELHRGEQLAPPTALHRAQLWLRNASSEDLQTFARAAAKSGRLSRRQLQGLERRLSSEGLSRSRDSAFVVWAPRPSRGRSLARSKTGEARQALLARPYAHPYYWAGFIYTGL